MSSNTWNIPQYLAKDKDKWLKLVMAWCPPLSVEQNRYDKLCFISYFREKNCTKFDIEFKESKYRKEYVPPLTKRPSINQQALLLFSTLLFKLCICSSCVKEALTEIH